MADIRKIMEDFKKLTDLLTGPYSQAEVAAALGVELQHFRQMRLSPDNRGHRPAPADWLKKLSPLAARVRADLAPYSPLDRTT
jgi:hypothetical protein